MLFTDMLQIEHYNIIDFLVNRKGMDKWVG